MQFFFFSFETTRPSSSRNFKEASLVRILTDDFKFAKLSIKKCFYYGRTDSTFGSTVALSVIL